MCKKKQMTLLEFAKDINDVDKVGYEDCDSIATIDEQYDEIFWEE